MRVVLQCVQRASVIIQDTVRGSINRGLVVFLGVAHDDEERDVDWMLDRVIKLRVFPDVQGKMNRSLVDVGGSLLVVSQFTLFADTANGRRPSFFRAAGPEKGRLLYERFLELARSHGMQVETGEFGAHMVVDCVNDGPVTIVLDSKEKTG